jgi:superfamily II DNA or RNA helicase
VAWRPKASLSAALAKHFDSTIRERGSAYYRQGRVKVVAGGAAYISARVRGTHHYEVGLDLVEQELIATCTCPYYSDNGLCKHLWATVLAAEAVGHLSEAAASDRLELVLDDGVDDGEPFEPAFEVGLDEEDEARAARPGRKQAPPLIALEDLLRRAGHAADLSALVGRRLPPSPPLPAWQNILDFVVTNASSGRTARSAAVWPPGQQLVYCIDAAQVIATGEPALHVFCRRPKKSGGWSKPSRFKIYDEDGLANLPDPLDRQVLAILCGTRRSDGYSWRSAVSDGFPVSSALLEFLLPLLSQSGRFFVQTDKDPWDSLGTPYQFDDGPAWELCLQVAAGNGAKSYALRGALRRGDETLPLAEPALLLAGGWVFARGRAARLHDPNVFPWISALRSENEIPIPRKDAEKFVTAVMSLPTAPRLDLPADLRIEELRPAPRPRLVVSRVPHTWNPDRLQAGLSFLYDDLAVHPRSAPPSIFRPDRRQLVRRDLAAEQAARQRLIDLGLKPNVYVHDETDDLRVSARQLPTVLPPLLADGWQVEVEGKPLRRAGAFKIEVRSGIDWFELHGSLDFGGASVSVPALLAAIKKGQNTIVLNDGSVGTLPEEWLRKWGLLAAAEKVEGDYLRFRRSQTAVLDALLAAQPEARCDEVFDRARQQLRRFDAVQPADEPPTFTGQLRSYQREGLGWLNFLQQFGLGGCLADDMGLGKTVQVLALLDAERGPTGERADRSTVSRPSLVVVPRSLLFNWKDEAARFTPHLRVLEHAGQTRQKKTPDFAGYDLVLTTYGTLRRDAAALKNVDFHYVILDEAQAIKNADTASAKAARLLRARHRLALSGTPVENHLGELWSLIEFLNPGMLGAASVFQTQVRRPEQLGDDSRALLARALRPVILRRTKAQVARDLPPRTEQTIYCELPAEQRKHYNEIRDHFRQTLLSRVDEEGLAKSKIHVLEALLRLRQAACHLALIDQARRDEPSAKLEALFPQLAEVIEEGHKALVFSQFTSFLAIVRERLDREGVPYAYLDGQTTDRAACVERFQTDPKCPLFLISLKAGGLGLNLTAAEYVFLLDPWWNPAVEAQAIDRTHRIGQTQQVFAYRLIARDTVEEKVLELQRTKRELADAIINADNSLIGTLTRDDLALLLG